MPRCRVDLLWVVVRFGVNAAREGRPKQYLLSARNIASFPFRLCNPPPSVGKVRSLSVVPLYKVRLEDVLSRKHLPPLGLKDFEEWLLFVELSPENLYFFLWLREYKRRYRQWKSQIEFKKSSHPTILPDFQYSTHLNMFYARAKQTFFTPGSEYELNLSSSLLAPFHTSDAPPYPDPDLFVPVELEVRHMLEDSLRRFIQGQMSNMGSTRIVCGIIAGIFVGFVGTTPPLVINFVQGNGRWERLLALPGLFFGIWLLICSVHGVCLAIYLFGDLRQLRQFELARPAISNPIPLDFNRPLQSSVSSHVAPSIGSLPLHTESKSPKPRGLKRISTNLSELTGNSMPSTSRSASIFDGNIQISQAYYDADEIDESAMYNEDNDGDFVENNRDSYRNSYWVSEEEDHSRGAPRLIFTQDHEGTAYVSEQRRDSISDYPETAKFIHPFEFNDGREDEQNALSRPERHQRVDNFDFDLLPRRLRSVEGTGRTDRNSVVSPLSARVTVAPTPVELAESERSFGTSVPSSPTSLLTRSTFNSPQHGLFFPPALKLRAPDPRAPPVAPQATNFIARLQEKRCNIKRYRLQPGYLESGNGYSNEDPSKPHPSSRYWMQNPKKDVEGSNVSELSMTRASTVLGSSSGGDVVIENKNGLGQQKEKKIKTMLRKISTVPAFRSPLTKVFSPIVRRGQWEIVVRTAAIGLILAWVIMGFLLAIPVPGRKHIHIHTHFSPPMAHV